MTGIFQPYCSSLQFYLYRRCHVFQKNDTQPNDTQYDVTQHSGTQHNDALHNSIQYDG